MTSDAKQCLSRVVRRTPVWFGLYLMALCIVIPAAGQTTFGSISGTVTDPTGAVIANAKVTVTNEGTGIERQADSAATGVFNVQNLAVGPYRVRIEVPGFRNYDRGGLSLNANQALNIDARLDVAGSTETVEVTAAAPVINTETQTLSYVKTSRDLEQLPLVARSAGDFGIYGYTYSNPGVSRISNQSNPAVNGGRILDTQLSIDGIAVMAYISGMGGGPTQPSMEGIEQVNIELAGTQAEFAHPANFTVVTKSGTNTYHGTAFYDYNGNRLNARDFFASSVPFRVYHNLGASIGGPIQKNKTFFFGDYEASREAATIAATGNTPLVPWRSGDFGSTKVNDPTTGQQFLNNQIPANRISSVSQNIQSFFYPLPNFGAANLQSGNWRGQRASLSGYTEFDHFDLRADHNFSTKDVVFARFGFRRLPHNTVDTGTPLPPVGDNHEVRATRTAVLSWAHSFNPTLINEFRTGYIRMYQFITPAIIGSDVLKQVGVQGINVTGVPNSPAFLVTGISATGNISSMVSRLNIDQNYEFTDNVSLTRGSHFLKFGFDAIRDQVFGYSQPVQVYGSYSFTGTYTGAPYADFLLGIPQSTSRAQPNPHNYLFGTLWSLYAQDQYKVSRKLTLNYGLRYELTTPYNDKNGNIFSFDRANGSIVVPDAALKSINPLYPKNLPIISASQAGYASGSLIDTDKNNFYGRFGFAYKPFSDDRTVVRGGYGIYDNAIYSSIAFYQMTGGPFSGSETFTNALTGGAPLFSFPSPFLAVGATSTQNISGINPRLHTPYTQQFTLTVERQVGSIGLRVGYVGTRSIGLIYQANINQPPASTTPFSPSRRFYPLFNTVTWYDNGGTEQYNALQFSASKTYGKNLFFNTGFTWAKDLTDTQTTGAFAIGPPIQDQFNRRAERGNNLLTRPERLYVNTIYNLPVGRDQRFLKSANRYLDGIVGGWSTSWVSEIEAGQYYTPTFAGGFDPSNTNNFGPSPSNAFIARPDRIGSGVLSSGQSITNWFDASAFAIPGCPNTNPVCTNPAPVGRFGNSGVNILRGPKLVNFDFSAMKYFRINERARVQFRMLATNVFNHPNFANPQANISSAGTVGRINASFQEQLGEAWRQIHFNLRVEF